MVKNDKKDNKASVEDQYAMGEDERPDDFEEKTYGELEEDLKDDDLIDLPLSDLDLHQLITESKDTSLERYIAIFNPTTERREKMLVRLKPISHGEWVNRANKEDNKKGKTFMLLVLAETVLDSNGRLLTFNELKALPSGTIERLYAKVRDISGYLDDLNL